jgi:putative ABC transport system permease protein
MAIGAKGKDILAQLMIEAILISFSGGIIGVLIGIGVSGVVKLVISWPISIEPYSVILSFLVCTLIAVFFGWYPAKKASQMDPIEALRYEYFYFFVSTTLSGATTKKK